MYRLTLLFTVITLSLGFALVSADDTFGEIHHLFKRDYKLPYDALPSANCSVPAVCSKIPGPVNCRCSDMLTMCQNGSGQFCWGSQKLNQTQNCPAVPETCSSQFNGTSSCLCNTETVLCVDGYNHYCYGKVQNTTTPSGTTSASVSLGSLPLSAPTGSSSASPAGGQESNSPSKESAASPIVASAAMIVSALIGSTLYLSS
ncbi:hypothetical protein BX666DRAFT_1880077 [Dichotomocladium elegans]|nr:hypothetical protein BX666DRAFT_1880077 [Dichotomocladium elegans]